VQFAYTQSRDSMRGDPFPEVLNDELDTFDFSGEDPIENGRSRQTTFEDAHSWHISTPMSDSSGITELYNRSQVRWTYQTPCPECGDFFELWDWGIVEWLGGMDADPLVAAANCWLKCPCCDQRIGLGSHRWMIQHGIWITQGESIESDGTVLRSLNAHGELAQGWGMMSRLTSDAFRKDEDAGVPCFDPLQADKAGTGDDGSSEDLLCPSGQSRAPGEGEDQDPLRLGDSAPPPSGRGRHEEGDLYAGYSDHARRYGVRIVGDRDRGPKHGYRVCTMQSLVSAEGIPGLVKDFLEHEGRPNATWWRDRLGRSPSTKGDRVEITDLELLATPVEQRGHLFGQCPEDTVAVFGGIDVQKRCIKLLANAYGPQGNRKAMVWAAEIPRDEALRFEDVRRALFDLPVFPVRDAKRKLTARWFIDSGYETRDVYQLVHDLERIVGRGLFTACKGMSNPESKTEMYSPRRLREMTTPDGQRVLLPYEIELVQVNGHAYRDRRAPRLVPFDEDTLDRLRASFDDGEQGEKEFRAMLERNRPTAFPALPSWPEGLARRVFAEIAEDEKVRIGQGSGRPGADGRGRPREVWRKRVLHRPNDWGDCDIYADACADRHGIMEWTPEMVAEQIARIEQQLAGEGQAVRRPAPTRSSTIAGEAARDRIF
jgi:phage terminase large subunit GpA-like protein